jgi:integrase
MALFDENGQRIRGRENKEAAEMALARIKVASSSESAGGVATCEPLVVAKVCSEYIQYCERGVASGTVSKGHRDNTVHFLNDLCKYCGALPVAELKKAHIKTWLESHTTWRSTATHHAVVAIVQAAFNQAAEMHGIGNPLKGLKRPASRPRLHSFSAEAEAELYAATEQCFHDFLFAAIHTGLRPFCELARLTADDVEENPRGMMWRVYSTKTKKKRKIPVRSEVAELTRRLMKSAPRGTGLPLFRNTRGKPWKRMTGVVRFLAIKKKLNWDTDPVKSKYSCYTCRHTFAHRMLSGYWTGGVGCSIETLAELMGDTPKVAFDHYGKEWGQHCQDPLWAAIGYSQQKRSASAGQDSTTLDEEKSQATVDPKRRTKKRGPATAKRRGATP